MDARKDYVAPAIAAEDTLEQTSLACGASQPWPGVPGETFAQDIPCRIEVQKGGHFGPSCTIFVPFPPEVVVLS
jgi:hypothetical protein